MYLFGQGLNDIMDIHMQLENSLIIIALANPILLYLYNVFSLVSVSSWYDSDRGGYPLGCDPSVIRH